MGVRHQVSATGFHCWGNSDSPGQLGAESRGFSCLSQSLDHFLLITDVSERDGNVTERVRMNKHLSTCEKHNVKVQALVLPQLCRLVSSGTLLSLLRVCLSFIFFPSFFLSLFFLSPSFLPPTLLSFLPSTRQVRHFPIGPAGSSESQPRWPGMRIQGLLFCVCLTSPRYFGIMRRMTDFDQKLALVKNGAEFSGQCDFPFLNLIG